MYIHIVLVNNVWSCFSVSSVEREVNRHMPAHLDGHAWCQIEFSRERHSPLLSPRGFQERMGHDLWSVQSEKIEIVIGTWNVYVRRGKMSKKRREKSRFGRDREWIFVSWFKTLNKLISYVENYRGSVIIINNITTLTNNCNILILLELLFQIASVFLSFFP